MLDRYLYQSKNLIPGKKIPTTILIKWSSKCWLMVPSREDVIESIEQQSSADQADCNHSDESSSHVARYYSTVACGTVALQLLCRCVIHLSNLCYQIILYCKPICWQITQSTFSKPSVNQLITNNFLLMLMLMVVVMSFPLCSIHCK